MIMYEKLIVILKTFGQLENFRNQDVLPDSVKLKIVNEVFKKDLLSRGSDFKKYFINRKAIDSWVTKLSTLKLTSIKISRKTIAEITKYSGTKIPNKQFMDLTKELEQESLILRVVSWRQW